MEPERTSLDVLQRELQERLGGCVEIETMALPSACSSLWLGFTGTDRIGINPEWPGTPIEVAGHAIGHLVLGHCGQVRDGGQFACAVHGADMSGPEADRLRRLLHDTLKRFI